jgi:DNA-binding CsgD family transcriptional regulator
VTTVEMTRCGVVVLDTNVSSRFVARGVGAAAEAAFRARGEEERLSALFELSPVPLAMVDDERRYVEVNGPARSALRLGEDEIGPFTLDDTTPMDQSDAMEQGWARLLDTGCVAGPYRLVAADGTCLEVACCALANMLPGLHVLVFAPLDWPVDQLEAVHGNSIAAWLSPREIEVLALVAEGRAVPELAEELTLSPQTVKTYLKRIYSKLCVRKRAGAVATGMRLGMI